MFIDGTQQWCNLFGQKIVNFLTLTIRHHSVRCWHTGQNIFRKLILIILLQKGFRYAIRDDSSFRWHFQIGFPPTSVALWPPSQFFSFPAKTLLIRSKVDISLQQKSKMGSDVPYFSSCCGQVCKWYDVFWESYLNCCIWREIENIAMVVKCATDVGGKQIWKCHQKDESSLVMFY